MKTFCLRTELWLPQPRAKIFAFFADPRNLNRLTPKWLRFRIESADTSNICCGAKLDYRLRIHGIPIHWQSEISAWEPPNQFIDRQIIGPYALWIHRHTFAENNGGTMVGDEVEYAVTGGALVQKLFVAPDLARIFNYRHRVLREIFDPSNITVARA